MTAKYRPPPATGMVTVPPGLRTLDGRLADRRVVTVTAGPGWGKTTVLRALLGDRDPAWYVADTTDRDTRALADGLLRSAGRDPGRATDLPGCAAELRAAWQAAPGRPVVIDDAQVLVGSPAAALLATLTERSLGDTQLVVLSRTDLGLVDDRRLAQGDVLQLDATHLAFDLDATAGIVERDLTTDRALAARITDATGGWPVAVQLVVGALRAVPAGGRSAATEALTTPTGTVGRYLETVVLPEVDDTDRRTLIRLALVPGVTAAELAGLLGTPPVDTARRLGRLVTRGLARTDPSRPDLVDLAPSVQRFVRDRLQPDLDPDGHLVDEVVAGLVDAGRIVAGLGVLTGAGRTRDTAALLSRHGRQLIPAGELKAVTDAASTLPPDRRDREVESLHAAALVFRGEWAAALRCLDAAGVGSDGPLPTDLAVTAGLIHHVRGDLEAALAAYRRGPEHDEDDPEHAALATWRATAHWLRGELDQARACAATAMATAALHGDDRALAYAHTAAALVAATDGDRRGNESHYRQALTAAQRAGDGLQEGRIRTNLGSHHLEEGRYAEALEETEQAIDLAESQGFAVIMGVARCNRAEILLRTGALDEAIADAERAREIFAHMGSRTEAYAHHLLGAARTDRGELVLARQAYDRALRLGRPAGDRQALVPAYLGSARATLSTDPDAARDAVEQARLLDDGMTHAEVQLVAAWVEAAQGRVDAARRHADEAIEDAEHRGNQAVVAEAMTCRAVLDDDPIPGLQETRELWRDLDAPLWLARIELGIARRSPDPTEHARVPWLERQLTALGCPSDRGSLPHRMVVGATEGPRTLIRALGGFVVEREGRPVPASAWGSRKARELLKVLATRGGRSVTREELGHLLWPDEPYERISNRLSVALSLVRGVLSGNGSSGSNASSGGSGESTRAAIVSDPGRVRLDLGVVDVDVETFRRLADDGLRASREGDRDEAVALLLRAEELYGGDLLEDDPDAGWVADRRTALRSQYLGVARTLAGLVANDDPDLTIRLLLRVLDRDGYDEPAHLNLCIALLRAGRHGEARRRYRLYADRMAELDLPAVPFHEVSREVTGSGTGVVQPATAS